MFAPISAPVATRVCTPQDREGLDRRIGLDLDGRVDPGRLRIDDRDAGEHVLLVDPVTQYRSCVCELCARVDTVGLSRVRGDVRGDPATVGGDDLDRVGEIELALHVVWLDPVECGPQRLGAKDVDGGVDLADLLLFLVGVAAFDDPEHRPVRAAHDAAVDARIRRLCAEDRRHGTLTVMRLDQ